MDFARRDIGVGRERQSSLVDAAPFQEMINALPTTLRKKFEELTESMAEKQANTREVKKKITDFAINLNAEISRPKSKLREKLFTPEIRTFADKIIKDTIAALSKEREPKEDKNFEPLTPPENAKPPENNRFRSEYDGPYAMSMDLNRTAVEKFLALARLDGAVTLESMTSSRTPRYMDANADGTVTGKKGLRFGEKIKDNEDENPYYRTVPTQDGWRVEVKGDKLLQNIVDKPHKKYSTKERFVQEFNQALRAALNECVWKEKLTNVKDTFVDMKKVFMLIDQSTSVVFALFLSNGRIDTFISFYTAFILVVASLNSAMHHTSYKKTNLICILRYGKSTAEKVPRFFFRQSILKK